MRYDIRPLTLADQEDAWRLGSLAFGYHHRPMPDGWTTQLPAGRRGWGAFDQAGRLVAKAIDREQGQWFGGRVVPTCGVAGVVVTADLRGRGVLRPLITDMLAGARDRGAVISTLFATTPMPYRRFGWEEVGVLTSTTLPTAALAGVPQPEGMTLRPAVEADIAAVRALYHQVARSSVGMMDRLSSPTQSSAADYLASYDGVTLAIGPAGGIDGYACWERGEGYDAASRIAVDELVGMTAEATAALLSMLGSWASVAPTLEFRLPDPDPAHTLVSWMSVRVESRQPWMLRVVDAVGAVAARGWPTYLRGEVDLDLVDDVCPWNSGPHRLVLADGVGRLEPGGGGGVRLTARGLGTWFAGAAGPALLRRAGQLSGGDPRTDDLLQVATAGPRPALLDYF